MTAVRLIPCLDVREGRVVKGVNFVDLRDAGDPVEQARIYDQQGADELCFLDISASAEGKETMYDVVYRTAGEVFLPLTVGGGVREVADFQKLLTCGADKVSVNSAALQNPGLISAAAGRFGAQCVVVAIDARRDGDEWVVFSHGGRKPTGRDALAWGEEVQTLGAGEILLTSMDRDGTGDGFDLELLAAMRRRTSLPIIASGGAGSLQDLVDAVTLGKADAVLAASIFHFGTFTIPEARHYMAEQGVEMRLDQAITGYGTRESHS